MKKFFISAVMAIAALSASAQQPAGGLSLTPYIGLGYAIASEKIVDEFDGYFTSVVGVEATYKATDLFGISLGFDYGYGQTSTKKETFGSTECEIYLNHYMINLPVMAQLHFGQFAIKAGIQPGWIISPEGHNDYKNSNMSGNYINNIKDYVKSFQMSVPVGICYSPNFPLQFDLRYSIPMSDYFDTSKFTDAKNCKLGTIMLTVGYRFDLGR